MVDARIKIMWDPPNEYIKEERHNKDDHIDRTVLEAIGTTPLYVHITFRGPGGGVESMHVFGILSTLQILQKVETPKTVSS